jgi:oligopeptide/dipeptide ABC transporter ATP-binding protein
VIEVPARAPLLSVEGLTVSFATDGGLLRAVSEVSFEVRAGSIVALVGESGSGKSVTAFSILRLIPSPPGKIEAGRVILEGRDLLALSEREMREVRGARIAMIFQEPMTSLNPVYTVGAQVMEAVRLHRSVSRGDARTQAIAAMRRVGLPRPEELQGRYPHELSGGMRQRVMIAMALACEPALLVADEPTTALDMMTQSQILALLQELRRDLGMSVLLISHDFGVVGEMADDVVVLYAGQVVENGPAPTILSAPRHPYTRALLASVPPRLLGARAQPGRRLPTIEGMVPDLRSLPYGCRFQDRCPDVFDRCRIEEPDLFPIPAEPGAKRGPVGAGVRCFLHAPEAS